MLTWLAWGELVILLVVLAAACATRGGAVHRLRRVARAWAHLARHRRLSVIGIGLLTFGLAALVSSARLPVPRAHDEFSYLLAADTLARGRITNPTHPMWVHFETFHVIHQPSYASKFPPAPALPMALGQRLAGHPIVGVWLATALAAATICWMLQGWMPPRWALVGGLLVALNPGVQFLWGQSYWGGAVATAGSALAFGAFARLVRDLRWKDAVVLASGVGILANSRPLEGLIASLVLAGGLGLELLVRKRHPLRRVALQLAVPCALVLALIGAAMAYYNHRITGVALRTPYQVHEATYGAAPLVLWKTPGDPPPYRHAVIEEFHLGFAQEARRRQHTLSGVAATKAPLFAQVWLVFVRPALTLPLLLLPWVLGRPHAKLAAAALALVCLGTMGVPWLQAHYLAPALPLFFLLAVEGLRHLATLRWRSISTGRALVVGTLALQVVVFLLAFASHRATPPAGWQWRRAQILGQLGNDPDQHLVVVRYGDKHNVHAEWVYNEAEIDEARVVWAREMDPEADGRLLDYFRHRRAWLLLADAKPPKLVAHPGRRP